MTPVRKNEEEEDQRRDCLHLKNNKRVQIRGKIQTSLLHWSFLNDVK